MKNCYEDSGFKVSIVILSKDEEKTIGQVVREVSYITDNVFVIDDSSTDKAEDIARNNGAVVIRGPGRGKGAAVRYAIDRIQGDAIVFIDADGSHKTEDIPKLLKPIVNNEADLTIASRFKGNSEELHGSFGNFMRMLGNIMATFIINFIWGNGKRLTDTQNGFRAIKINIAKELCLKEDSFAIEQEMVIKCLKKGFRILEIPTYEFKREYGKSHIEPLSMLPKYICCLFNNL